MLRDIGILLVRHARTHNKFTDRTGKLTRSIRFRVVSDDVLEFYSDADYSIYVMRSTNENFLTRAVRDNMANIEAIIGKYTDIALRDNQHIIRRHVETYADEMLASQFDQLFRS